MYKVPAPAGQHAEAHLQGQAGPGGQGGRPAGDALRLQAQEGLHSGHLLRGPLFFSIG